MNNRPSLKHYLAFDYPYSVEPDDGSYFIRFPDLPGCMTQVEDAGDIGPMAEEIKRLWLETAYEDDLPIPEPAVPSGYSGRFVVRVPKHLHRELATAARQQNVSLNAYVTHLLGSRTVAAELGARLERIEQRVSSMDDRRSCHRDPQPDTSPVPVERDRGRSTDIGAGSPE